MQKCYFLYLEHCKIWCYLKNSFKRLITHHCSLPNCYIWSIAMQTIRITTVLWKQIIHINHQKEQGTADWYEPKDFPRSHSIKKQKQNKTNKQMNKTKTTPGWIRNKELTASILYPNCLSSQSNFKVSVTIFYYMLHHPQHLNKLRGNNAIV